MKKFVLFGLLLLISFPLLAQASEITVPADSIAISTDSLFAVEDSIIVIPKTVIYGNTTAERYGAALELRTTKDGITNTERVLGKASVGSQGEFRFEFDADFSGAVFIPLDAVNGFLFIEAEKTYNVELPPVQKKTRAEQFDPYFRPASMILSVVEPDEDDITVKISEFEDAFDQYYMRCLVARDRDTINAAISSLRKETGVSKSRFVEDYKKYRYALLASILPAERPHWALTFINQTDVAGVYASPAFWEIFDLVFDNFFTAFPGKEEQMDIERAIRQNDMTAMEAILDIYFEIDSAPLQQLVIIKGLMDLYNRTAPEEKKDNDKRSYLLSILEEYAADGNLTERNQEIAQNVISKLKKTNVGEKAFNFRLPDEKGKMHSLSDFRGNHVYLHFANAFITQSKQDLPVLSRLAQRFRNFKVINIFVYNTAEDLQQLPPDLKKGTVNLLWNNNAALLEEYQLRNVPTFYFIDPQGNFLFSPAPSPGEGFEEKFSRMMFEKEKEGLSK